MPSTDTSPNFALLSQFDARPFTSTLYTRMDAAGVVQSIALGTDSQIIFDDAIHFLNGRGQSPITSLKSYLEANLPSSGDLNIGISTGDKIFINTVDFSPLARSMTTTSGPIFGFNAGVESYDDGQITAPYDWSRNQFEVVNNASTFVIVNNSDIFTPRIPHIPFVQSIPALFRERTSTELFCLESIEELLFYSGTTYTPAVCWVINSDGKVVQYVDTDMNPNATTFAWVDTTFRDRLGFNGREVWTAVNSKWNKITANNALPGALLPTRPLTDNHLKISRISNPRRKIGGGYVSNFLGNYVTHSLSFFLDGPADQKDEYNHYAFVCGPYFYAGAPVTLYQDWGETRSSLLTSQVSASQFPYSLLATSEKDGRYGKVKGTITAMTDDLMYPEGIRRRIPITMEIERDA